LNAVPIAAYSIIPGFWSFRHRVVDGLHSLHGGDAKKVDVRRERPKKIIDAAQPNSEVPDWQLGLPVDRPFDPSLTGDSPDALYE